MIRSLYAKAAKATTPWLEATLNPIAAALAIAIVGALGAVGYAAYKADQRIESDGQRFTCDGRTHCSQMTSCAEAVYFLENCPNAQMDGNNDGEPCEEQWCD